MPIESLDRLGCHAHDGERFRGRLGGVWSMRGERRATWSPQFTRRLKRLTESKNGRDRFRKQPAMPDIGAG